MNTSSMDNGSQDENKHPFLARICSYITYEEVYGSSISLNEIIDLVRSLPLKYWCVTASTSVLILEYHEFEEEYQGMIFNHLFPEELLKTQIKTDGGKRVFFHRMQLIDEGYLKQILISHDNAVKHTLRCYGGWGYDHILTNIVPLMRLKGMSDEQIHTVLVENPKRVLSLVPPRE